MQKHAFERRFRVRPRQILVQREVAVLGVAGDRQADARHMNANLMRAPRLEFRLDPRVVVPALDQVEHRVRRQPVFLDTHAPFPVARYVFVQRRLHDAPAAPVARPVAVTDRVIALVDAILANLLVQVHERRALFREHQHAGRLAIQPMHEFEKLRVRPRIAQLFDDAERHAAAAVHGDAGRFVDDDQVVVFEEDREFGGGRIRRNVRFIRLRDANRRHAHEIAEFEAIRGIDAALVHAHFPAAQNPVDVALGYALADAQQEIVDSLTGRAFIDFDHRDLLACDLFLGCFA